MSRLDVLIYPEIGMDKLTTKLASMRLAPVQVASWGHPETSGLPTIDHYLSAQGLEPEGVGEHHTERLVLLPQLGSPACRRGERDSGGARTRRRQVVKGGNSQSNSRRSAVGMMQTAQHGTSDNATDGSVGAGEGRLKGQAPMRSVVVVIARKLAEDCR